MEITINCLACQDSGTMYLSDDCYGECLYCSSVNDGDVKPMKKQSPKRKKNKTKTRKVNPLYVNYRL